MIFGLGIAFGALDAERREIVAQPRQRALVQEAGEIVGPIGQQLAAAEPDEEIEIFALDALDLGFARGLGQRRMRDAKRRRIAAQTAPGRFSSFASGARASSVASSAYSCARAAAISSTSLAALRLAVEVGPQHLAVDAGRSLDR